MRTAAFPGTIGPSTIPLACANPVCRAIGAANPPPPATSGSPEPDPVTVARHVPDGRSGSSEMSRPGPLTSAGTTPDVTLTCCHGAIGGTNTGPPRVALEMSTSSIRNAVCVQDVRKAPRRTDSAGFTPPEKWSLMTAACVVSSSENRLSAEGRSRSNAASNVDVSGRLTGEDCWARVVFGSAAKIRTATTVLRAPSTVVAIHVIFTMVRSADSAMAWCPWSPTSLRATLDWSVGRSGRQPGSYGAPALSTRLLNGRAWAIGVRAVDTTVPRLRPHDNAARRALVEVLATIGRHRRRRCRATRGTRDGRRSVGHAVLAPTR